MKKTTLLIMAVLLLMAPGILAQNVGINDDGSTPDNSAMLDVKSSSKGILIPRIDFNNKPASPATGLMIYVTTNGPDGNNAFYYYDGSGWVKIIGGADADWTVSGNDIYSSVSGNVGIGTANPTSRLAIKNSAPTGYILSASAARSQAVFDSYANASNTGPVIELNTSKNPAIGSHTQVIADDQLGVISFGGSDGTQFFPGAQIRGYAQSDYSVSKNGSLLLQITKEGVLRTLFELTPSEAVVNQVSQDIDFRVESDISEHALFVQGSDGNIGINNSSPSVALDVIGDIEYTGTITEVSDKRLKENITPLTNAIDKVKGINGVCFNMKDNPDKMKAGVIAQEVQKVLPEAVNIVDKEKGYLGVSYTSLVPLLIEAIKEQQQQIEELKKLLQEKH